MRAVFRKLFARARMLAAKQIVPYHDEQITAEQDSIARWNAQRRTIGLGRPLRAVGTANSGGMQIVELRPGAAEDAPAG